MSPVPKFVLHRPETLGEALETLWNCEPDAVLMAGGVDVTNRLKSGLDVGHVIYLSGIEELQGIVASDSGLRVAAGVTHGEFEGHPLVRRYLPGLSEIWGRIGSVRIRHAGTLAGNILTKERAYDVAPVLASLGARLHFEDAGGKVAVAVEELQGYGGRAPENISILTAIEIPTPPKAITVYSSGYKPVAAVAVTACKASDDLVEGRVAVGCAFPSLVEVETVRLSRTRKDSVGPGVEEAT